MMMVINPLPYDDALHESNFCRPCFFGAFCVHVSAFLFVTVVGSISPFLPPNHLHTFNSPLCCFHLSFSTKHIHIGTQQNRDYIYFILIYLVLVFLLSFTFTPWVLLYIRDANSLFFLIITIKHKILNLFKSELYLYKS